MHYTTSDGPQVLDGTAGLWCVNAGHCRPKIVEAIQKQAPSSTMRRPSRWAIRRPSSWPTALVDIAPEGIDHVFFTNSGSESVETALKIALAYQRARARARALPPDRPRARLSRRQLRRHLGRRHRQQPQDVRHAADRRRPPAAHPRPRAQRLLAAAAEHGAELADELERLVALHDASTIAAVIVEPVAGSTGVLIPPKGYLERLREICDQARHPADLRRGHHRLRPPRHAVRGRLFRRDARHHH
jgi:beta-alanine--pyruvate transaminase